jgi:hypothetical protein
MRTDPRLIANSQSRHTPRDDIFSLGLRLIGLVPVLLLTITNAYAGLHEGFETPEPTWKDSGGDTRYRFERHERTQLGARSGNACEFFDVVAGPGGTHIYVSHDIGRAPVLAELRPSVWVRSDRPGIQLFAEVIFPRVIDPKTKEPLSTLIAGGKSGQVGVWEHLKMEDMPKAVDRQTRFLRAKLGRDVDIREAYVDRLLLNIYSGPARSQIWIDDLDVAGFVESVATPQPSPTTRPASNVKRETPAAPPTARATIELSGSVLLADGKPFFPRMIEHQGEPLSFLRARGFNAVRLTTLPSAEMLADAARLGMWIVCPPPRADDMAAHLPDLGPEYDPVLAWDLGSQLTARDFEATKRWAEQVRRADRQASRPILCDPDSELLPFSRQVNVLMMHRYPLGTSFEQNDYGTWLRERPRLALAGTPFWTMIQTQPSPELREQWELLSGRPPEASPSSDQIRLLAYMAMAAGARGVCFQSHSRLDATDAPTQMRAIVLELLNLELQLVEPWAAAGDYVVTIHSTTVAPPLPPGARPPRITDNKFQTVLPKINPEVSGVVLENDRARVLLPIWSGKGGQFVAGQWAGNNISFVVPGVPDSNDVYEITPGGLRPVRRQRVTGGVRVTLDEMSMASIVLLTQDPLVVNSLGQRLAEGGRRATELQRELSQQTLRTVEAIDGRLTAIRHAQTRSAELLASARSSLQLSDNNLATGDFQGAYANARRAARPLQLLERLHWEQAVKGLVSPTVLPLAVSFDTLPQHWALSSRLAGLQIGPNQLPEGNFEDLGRMVAAGWQHFQHSLDGVHTEAELSPEVEPRRGGRYSLRLLAKAVDQRASVGLIETPPVWITSPHVRVGAGQWLRIHGWVNVPNDITGSLDGLMVIDSITGEPLAERFGQTSGWQEFTMYRAVPRAGLISVTVALTGLGEAWLDNVTIEPLVTPGSLPESVQPAATRPYVPLR